MKKYILLIGFLALSCVAFAQTTNPQLLVNIQEASQAEIDAYNTADLEIGMLVYNTDVNRVFEYTNAGFVQILTELDAGVETVTTLIQDDASATGEITYTDEEGNTSTAQVVGDETDNQIEVGANGGAFLGPTVYTGFFIISAEGTTTVTGIPFEPSQVTFVANANVESLNIDSDNGTGNNDRGIDNSYGTMNGFARNIGGTLVQQAIYSGGHGNSINDISRYASSSNCIGIRYGDQNGSSLGKIEAAFGAFTADGFNVIVNYTDGVITDNNANALVNVQPGDVNNEALLVLYTAYK